MAVSSTVPVLLTLLNVAETALGTESHELDIIALYLCSDLELKLQGCLTVTIVKATGLRNAEMIGKSDPYAIAYVRVLFKRKTKTIDNNLNPEWNETFDLNVEDHETQLLHLKVICLTCPKWCVH